MQLRVTEARTSGHLRDLEDPALPVRISSAQLASEKDPGCLGLSTRQKTLSECTRTRKKERTAGSRSRDSDAALPAGHTIKSFSEVGAQRWDLPADVEGPCRW